MPTEVLETRTPTPQDHGRPRTSALGRWRWLAVPVAVLVVSRVVDAALLTWLMEFRAPDDMASGHGISALTYLQSLTIWDGQWYARIVADGYPATLPRFEGEIAANPWAFYPGYPLLVAGLVALGLSFPLAATVVSTSCTGLAVVLLYRMVARRADSFIATLCITALLFSPAALVFQAAYGEGLALLLVVLALWCLEQRRYGRTLVVALLLSLSRPIVLPLAAVMGVIWLLRFHQRHTEPFPVVERVRLAGTSVATALSFVIWPLTVGIATGEWDAYAQTQRNWLGPGQEWSSWLREAVSGNDLPITVAVFAALGVLAWVVYRPQARVWSPELRAWSFLYALYILGSSRTTPSVFRYLVLVAVPGWPLPEVSTRVVTPAARTVLLVAIALAGTAMQFVWIRYFYFTPMGGLFP